MTLVICGLSVADLGPRDFGRLAFESCPAGLRIDTQSLKTSPPVCFSFYFIFLNEDRYLCSHNTNTFGEAV